MGRGRTKAADVPGAAGGAGAGKAATEIRREHRSAAWWQRNHTTEAARWQPGHATAPRPVPRVADIYGDRMDPFAGARRLMDDR